MIRRSPRYTLTDTLFPYPTLFRALIRVCTVSNSLEPGFRSLIFCNKSINELGNWRRIDDGADAVTTAPDITPRLDAFRKVGLEKLEPIGKGIGIQASLHDRTAQECRR